jgi:hypothetical protein
MEPHTTEELVEARDALQRQLATLRLISDRTRSPIGSLPIVTKLRSQLLEIDELLESGEGENT